MQEVYKAISILCSRKNPLPILDCGLIRENRLTLSNLETFIEMPYYNCKGTGTLHKDILKQLAPGSVQEIVFNEENIIVHRLASAGNRECPIFFPAKEFPKVPTPGENLGMMICQEDIFHMATAMKYVNDDSLRPVQSGVCITQNRIVATNSFYLYFKDHHISNVNREYIIPVSAIKLLMLFPGLWQCYRDNDPKEDKNIIFMNDTGVVITTRLIDGNFPNYEIIIPESFNYSFVFDTQYLQDQLKAILPFTNKTTRTVEFYFHPTASLQAYDPTNDFRKQLDLSFEMTNQTAATGATLRIAFNIDYLQTVLCTMSDNITMEYISESRPVLFNKHLLLMPIGIYEG